MSIRANSSFNYKWRLALIALVCLGFGAYCIYDGFIAYPAQIERAYQFLEFKDDGRIDEWPAYAESQGWSIEDPGSPKDGFNLYAQYIMAAITLPIGLLFGVSYLRYMKRWIQADEQGLQTSGGLDVPWDAITDVDTARWKLKGIAVVQYQHGSGGPGSITLDDWKFEREETVAIFNQVAERMGLEIESDSQSDDASGDSQAMPSESTNAANASEDQAKNA